MTVLVVAAHPDDETLGAGGTIARMTRAGRHVAWLVLGEGSTSRTEGGYADEDAIAAQRRECLQAAEILGVTDVEQAELPDNRFDSIDLLEVARRIERTIERVQPAVVLTHHRHDLNVDHRLTSEAVMVATRPLPGCPVRTVATFEVLSSTEWGFSPGGSFEPSVFVDISDTIDAKVRAVEVYRGETRPFPHPRSSEGVRALAATRGTTAGVAGAEAFQLVRALR